MRILPCYCFLSHILSLSYVNTFHMNNLKVKFSNKVNIRELQKSMLMNRKEESNIENNLSLQLKSNELQKYVTSILHGVDAFSYLLSKVKYSQSPMHSSAIFSQWITAIIDEKIKVDNIFQNLMKVKELRKEFSHLLVPAEEDLRESQRLFETSKYYNELYDLDRMILGCKQSIVNMEKLDIGNPLNSSKRQFSAEQLHNITTVVLPNKRFELEKLIEKRNILRLETPFYFQYQQNIKRLDTLLNDIGLISLMELTSQDQTNSGNRRRETGKSFESTAFESIENILFPYLENLYNIPTSKMFLLQNVEFSIACSKGNTGEFDSLICVHMDTPERFSKISHKGKFCKVLAAVEVKRNPNDIGESFMSYQRSLAWLCGLQDTYDPLEWKNKAHPTGHFKDRAFLIRHNDNLLYFTSESFELFQRNAITLDNRIGMESMLEEPIHSTLSAESSIKFENYKFFIQNLYFVTKPLIIDGMSSKISSWILNKVATDDKFDIHSNEDQLESLRFYATNKFPFRLSTIEVLKLYESLEYNNQLVVIGKKVI